MSSKGPGKGSWKGWNQGKNKRGRDQRDDSRGHMNAERDSRQKTWQIDGRKTAESWFQSTTLQKHMRNIPLHSAKALRCRLIRANNEYQLNMKHVSFEHWNTRGNQPTAHDPEAGLRKELGMPPKINHQSRRTFILSRHFGIATRPSTPLLTPKLAKKIVETVFGVKNLTTPSTIMTSANVRCKTTYCQITSNS
jgi:hypothetical protein